MIIQEKKIAEKTLIILSKKSLNKLTVNEVLKNINNKNINFKSKIDLLKNINRYVDYLLIREIKSMDSSSTKDMLFEVFMARFDILQKNRKSFIEIYNSFKKNPQY